MIIVRLHEKKETPVLNGHPWIFAGAVDKVDDDHEQKFCRVLNAQGQFVCQGLYNPYSQIAVRVLTLGKEKIDRRFFADRIRAAQRLRQSLIPADTTCYRLVNAEGDHLPGLVVDVYGTVLVMQFLCLGMEHYKDDLVSVFKELYPGYVIHERSDAKSRKAEGLTLQSGPLVGELPEGDIEVMENGMRMAVDVKTGERTGLSLDHRINRAKVIPFAKDKDVLDLYSYSGGFGLNAIKGGARSVVSVDASAPAQALLKKNCELNGISPFVWKHFKDDVMAYLNRETGQFDIVICDPPPFANADDYIQVNAFALARLRPGGIMFTCASYATRFGAADLLKTVNRAAMKSQRNVMIIDTLGQAPDYPYRSSHPEGVHMHGLILYVG